MTRTSSSRVCASIITFTSAGAFMPTRIPFCTTDFRLGAEAMTSKCPGCSPGSRNDPWLSVYVTLTPPIWVSDRAAMRTPPSPTPV